MWRRFKDWLRFTLISPELLYSVVVLAVRALWPELFAAAGQKLGGELKAIDAVYGIPIACLAFSFPLMNKIIFPDESLKKELKRWPGFIALVDRVYFALALMAACSIGAIVVRFIGVDMANATRGFLTILFCGLAIVPVPSLVLAATRIKIITDEFGPK